MEQAKNQNSLEGVSTARGDLLAGTAPPDASHLAPGGVLAAEGARVLGVLGDLRDAKTNDKVRHGESKDSKRQKKCKPMFGCYLGIKCDRLQHLESQLYVGGCS